MQTDREQLINLAKQIVDVLETKACAGCEDKTWNFANGNGTEVGHHIDALIRRAKKIVKRK